MDRIAAFIGELQKIIATAIPGDDTQARVTKRLEVFIAELHKEMGITDYVRPTRDDKAALDRAFAILDRHVRDQIALFDASTTAREIFASLRQPIEAARHKLAPRPERFQE